MARSLTHSITIRDLPRHHRLLILTLSLMLMSGLAAPLQAFALQLNPVSLTFSATQGSATAAPQTLTFWKTSTSSQNWTAMATVPWLSASPASGSLSTEKDQVQVQVNPSGLAPGSYSTSLMITTTRPDGTIRKTAVPVSLAVNSTSTSGFTISPPSMAYTGTINGPNPVASVVVTNTGSSSLTVTWHDSINWLIATSGDTVTVPPGGSATIAHTASTATLWPGTFSGVATITGGGVTKQVPVTMTVSSGSATAPVIGLAPVALSFSGAAGGANPAAQTISVSNTGGGTLSWNASDNASWLTLTPASGTNAGTMNVSVNMAGLAAGTYNAAVTVTATGATTKTIPVSLTVTAASTTPAIGLSQASLSFSGTAGGSNPSTQTFSVSNTGGGTLSWSATDNAAWLTISPASGTNSGSISASVNLSGLAAGTYNAAVTVTATGAATKTVPVTLIVNPTGAGSTPFTVAPASMTYTGTVNGSNQVAGITITNTSAASLTVTWRDSINWLVATSGDIVTMPPGGSATITHTASMAGLAAGSYSGVATVTGAGVTKQVPIALTVATSSTTPAIGFAPTSLSFSGATGGANPAAQTITVSNTGGGTLSWTASDNAAWLTVTPTSGTNSGTITASANLSGLAAGTYTAAVTISATGAATRTVPVTLTVTSGTASGSIGFSPTSLAFSGTTGGTNPAAKSFTITNPGGGTLSWTVSDNAAWLSVTPTSGTTTTETDTLTASVNLSGLGSGTYSGTITITAAGASNSPRTIPVSLTLSAGTTGTATLSWNASPDSDLAGYKVYRATVSGAYGAPIATIGKTTTSYVATGLQPGTTYFFVISAYDSAGNESSYSNEVSKSIF